MPRAGDLYPDRRGANDVHSPLRGLLDYTSPLAMTAQAAGSGIKQKIEDVVAFIKATTGIDLSGVVQLVDLIGQTVGKDLFSMLDANSLIRASQIIGQLLPGVIGPVSINNLFKPAGDGAPSLWPSDFPVGAIGPADDWSVDADGSRSPDGTGAATVTADGTWHALRSGDAPDKRIPIGNGQTVALSMFVRHTGYVGTGAAAIQLHVVPFVGGVRGEPVVIDTYAPSGPDLDWPGRKLSGTFTATGAVDSFQTRLVVTDEALAGTIEFDDGKPVYGGGSGSGIDMSWIPGLGPAFEEADAARQLIIDTIVSALRRTGVFGNGPQELAEALQSIRVENILGVFGALNIGKSLTDALNAVVGGAVGENGTGATPADAFNIIKMISEWANRGNKAKEITDIRTNTPIDGGLGPSEVSNFPLSNITTWHPVTQATSLIGWDYVERDMPLGVVSWIGYGVTGITALYVVVWRVDLTTGNIERIHVSNNVVGLIAGAGNAAPGAYISYELPGDVPQLKAKQLVGYQVIPVGGTHNIRGRVNNLPAHPTAPIAKPASVYDATTNPSNPPALILKANIAWTDNVPWMGIAIDTGTGGDHHDPQFIYLGTKPTTLPVPDWCQAIVPKAVGDGGGAHLGGSWGFAGDDGEPGKWSPDTVWVRGVHFGDGAIITFDPGPGGTPGANPINQNGGDGAGATIAVADQKVVAPGGRGGKGIRFVALEGAPVGRGPEPQTYDGNPMAVGGDQHNYGGDGIAPGGGANGGHWMTVSAGGRGAPGGGWVAFLPEVPDDEPVPTDPPTAPTGLTLVAATPSTLTVRPTIGTTATLAGQRYFINGNPVTPNPVTGDYQIIGLASETEYTVTATNVDTFGQESAPSAPVLMTTAAYENPTGEFPLEAADRAVVDAIMTEELVSPGAVVGITGPRGYYTKAYGTAPGGAMTTDAHFRVQSLTKTFTATAIFMAVGRGQLSLDDTIEQYVPGVPNGTKITIRQMMMMQSGLPDYNSNIGVIGPYMIWPSNPNYSETYLLQIIRTLTPLFAPGTGYAYSNTNYVLLGAVLHAITGRPIRNIVLEDIIAPLGLTETYWPLPTQTAMPAPAAINDARNVEFLGAAGAIVSTVPDMIKWAVAMRDSTLIPPDLRTQWTEYFSPQSAAPGEVPARFGYGMGIISYGNEWLGHDGSWSAMDGVCFWHRQTGAIFVCYETSQTAGLVALVRMLKRIGAALYPGSMVEPPYPSVAAPVRSRRKVNAPVVGHHVLFGDIAVSDKSGSTNIAFAGPVAESGDYVVVDIITDRNGAPSGVKYNGAAMTALGSVVDASGGAAVARYGARHTGATGPGSITGTINNAWHVQSAVVLKNVSTAIPTTTSVSGQSGALSQGPVTCPEGALVLQTFGIGNGGALPVPAGGSNHAADYASYIGLVVNTSMITATFTATIDGRTPPFAGLATVFV